MAPEVLFKTVSVEGELRLLRVAVELCGRQRATERYRKRGPRLDESLTGLCQGCPDQVHRGLAGISVLPGRRFPRWDRKPGWIVARVDWIWTPLTFIVFDPGSSCVCLLLLGSTTHGSGVNEALQPGIHRGGVGSTCYVGANILAGVLAKTHQKTQKSWRIRISAGQTYLKAPP